MSIKLENGGRISLSSRESQVECVKVNEYVRLRAPEQLRAPRQLREVPRHEVLSSVFLQNCSTWRVTVWRVSGTPLQPYFTRYLSASLSGLWFRSKRPHLANVIRLRKKRERMNRCRRGKVFHVNGIQTDGKCACTGNDQKCKVDCLLCSSLKSVHAYRCTGCVSLVSQVRQMPADSTLDRPPQQMPS